MSVKRLRFLLVEDDDDHAELVQSIFSEKRPGDVVERVADGAQALAFLRHEGTFSESQTPDIVILDLNLPKMNGLEVLGEMKSDPGLQVIPVVVMTTSDDERDRSEAYGRRANSYVVKPMDFAKFEALVAEVGHYWADLNRPAAHA